MPTQTQTPEEVQAGLEILKHVILYLEGMHPKHPLSRPDQMFEDEDYELLCELSYLFAMNGRNGHTGAMPDGTRWNAGMTMSDREDEDGEKEYEPVFGFFTDAIHGVTMWQGDYLIARVREVLRSL